LRLFSIYLSLIHIIAQEEILSDLIVNRDKCKKDGICVAECPMSYIRLDEQGYPAVDPEFYCLSCGHCVAACPHGAISITGMNAADCPALDKSLDVTPAQAEQFLKSRRSMRQYKTEPVPKAELEKLIDIASYGPSGHNRQPIDWLVINGVDQTRKAAQFVVDWMVKVMQEDPQLGESFGFQKVIKAWDMGQERILRGAPHLFVAHAPKDDPSAPAAAGQVVAYLELAAWSMGLGSCWAGYFTRACQNHPALMDHLALPQGRQVFASVMVGRRKAKYYRLPLRRKPEVTWR
jgi:nitroreductase/ferredoxin